MTSTYVLQDYPNLGGTYGNIPYGRLYFKNAGGGDGFETENVYISAINDFEDAIVYWSKGPGKTQYEYGSTSFAVATYTYPGNLQVSNLKKLYGDLKGHDLNLGVSLAESGESLRSISKRLQSIARAYRAAKRGDFRGALEFLISIGSRKRGDTSSPAFGRDALAQNWLDFYYSIRPLLSDLSNAVKAYDNRYRLLQSHFRVRTSAKGKFQNAGFLHTWGNTSGEESWQLKVVLKAGYGLTTSEYLGLTDPATILWERVPTSFIIDWVLPIGNWLEAVHAVHTIQVSQAVESYYLREHCSNLQGKGVFIITGGEHVSKHTYDVNRSVDVSLSVPTLSFKRLNQSLGKHGVNILNTVALLSASR